MKKKTIALVVAIAMIMQIAAPTAWGITEELAEGKRQEVVDENSTKHVSVENVQQISNSTATTGDEQTEIVFADENFKNELLHYYDENQDKKLTADELKKITNLDYYYYEGPVDLQGLELATNLEKVCIIAPDIIHAEVLENATNLRSLTLYKTAQNNGECLENLNFIENYTKLETLHVQYANLENITLPNTLKTLGLDRTKVGNLADILEPLQNLTNLSISGKIEETLDISSIVNKKESLQELRLESIELTDISFVAELSCLQNLEIRWCGIENIEPITYLTQLEELSLMGNQIKDISGIENLVNLQELRIEGNQIEDFSILENMDCSFGNSDYNTIYQTITLEKETVMQGVEKEISLPPIIQSMYDINSKFYLENSSYGIYNNSQENVQVRINEDGTKLYVTCPEGLAKDQYLEIWFSGDGWLDRTRICISYDVKANGDNTEEIIFADEKLKNYLLENYDDGKDGKITPYDMAQITELSLYNMEGTLDLQGLEYAVNLKSFDCPTEITHASVLGQLSKLENLNIDLDYEYEEDGNGQGIYHFTEDVSFLENLSNLKRLYISYTDLRDITLPTTLEELRISCSTIGSIDHILQNLDNLQEFAINVNISNETIDFSELSKYTNLTTLSVTNSKVKDIQFVSLLTNLEYLNLSGNEIEDIAPVQNLTNLYYLGLSWNKIENIEPIKEMSFRENTYIDLSYNYILDLTPLDGKTEYCVDGQKIEKNVGNVYLEEEFQLDLPLCFQQILDKNSLFYDEEAQIEVTSNYDDNSDRDIVSYRLSDDKTKIMITANKLARYYEPKITVSIVENSRLANSMYTIQFHPVAKGDNTIELNIPDANFKNYLLNNYDDDRDGKITQFDMLQIVDLQIYYSENITNIQGVEYAKNLRMLSVDNYLDNIEYVTGLTNLEYLRLQCNNVEQIDQLANLTNLTSLSIYCSELEDISFVRNMPNLTSFGFGYQVTDITPLQGLTNLHSLYMYSNKITDISVLKTLPNLQYVSLSWNQVEDVSFLEEFSREPYNGEYAQCLTKKLGVLNKGESVEIELPDLFKRVLSQAENSKFYNPEATVTLQDYSNDMSEKISVTLNADKTKLIVTPKVITGQYETSFTVQLINGGAFDETTMRCQYTAIGTGDKTKVIEIPDETLKKQLLNEIDEDNNGWISEYEINQLESFGLWYEVENLEGLQYAENLNALYIEGYNFEALPKGLENITQINTLGLDNGKETFDISAIKKMTNLKELQLNGNLNGESVAEVLQVLLQLKKLELYGIEIGTIDFNQLTQLEVLQLSNCNLTQMPDLSNLHNLSSLTVNENHIEDISKVKNIPNLNYLSISSNKVKDISIIKECENLRGINIEHNCIEDISPYLEKFENSYLSLGRQTVTKTIQEQVTIGKEGYTIELPQIARYILQEKGGVAKGKGDVVFEIAEDNTSLTLLPGTVGPKIAIEFNENTETYCYNKVILTIEATITDQSQVEEVTFPDTAFKQEVLKQADINGDGKISKNEIQELTELNIIGNKAIKSIEGIEQAINLRRIEVMGGSIKDISPITSLEKLENFNFINNEITDVSCFEDAQFMESLYSNETSLAGNFIDFTEGNNNYNAYYKVMHTMLEEGDTNIAMMFDCDIHAQNYGTVEERFQEVPMQTALKNKLIEKGVDLDEDGIITQYEMYSANNINLNLANAGITDISGLEYLSTIGYLNLSNNSITDITPITHCNNLFYLNLDNNKITSLDGIENCYWLRVLSAKNNKITDLTPLGKLHFMICDIGHYMDGWEYRLMNINLSDNAITDITPVKDFMNLGTLNLSNNQIRDIASLQNYNFHFTDTMEEEENEAWAEYLTINVNGNYIDTKAQKTKDTKAVFDEKGACLLLENQKEEEDIIKGDFNKDGKVGLYDAFKILEFAILGSNLSAEEIKIMDYNEDGKVTLYDAFKFLEIAILG